MQETFDFVIVGGGSAGAVVAARLSEDPSCRVALIEAGDRPPDIELMPIAGAAMQKNSATDWMYTADPGSVGLGLVGLRIAVPRGRMLGGSSGMNYLAYVRGHPEDFDSWAAGGATGWSYADVLPYFLKSEGLVPSPEADIDAAAHNTSGPLGVSVRSPSLRAAREFVEAAEAAGIPRGDYNGGDRRGRRGVVSLMQATARDGKRSSTYRAFMEGEAENRENLTILTQAQAVRITVERSNGALEANGVEYRTADGQMRNAYAAKEVILCAGAIGSPHLLMLSGIGPEEQLKSVGLACAVDSPEVGQHLKDHIQVPLFFHSCDCGVKVSEVGISMGPAALRHPFGPLPADPADDASLPADLKALKEEAERRLAEWATTGKGLAASSLYDAAAWYSTGLGDLHSHDGQISCLPCGFTPELWRELIHMDLSQYLGDISSCLLPAAANVLICANPVLPHSEGEVRIQSADPTVHPELQMNYLVHPHDRKVMIAILRRAFEIVRHWPGESRLGRWMAPPMLAAKHRYLEGTIPNDDFMEDIALHFSMSVYHLASTCRIGSVVDAQLRVGGIARLRVADASIMPNLISGNINAACIMIGEKAAEMIAVDHGVRLGEFVGCFSSPVGRGLSS